MSLHVYSSWCATALRGSLFAKQDYFVLWHLLYCYQTFDLFSELSHNWQNLSSCNLNVSCVVTWHHCFLAQWPKPHFFSLLVEPNSPSDSISSALQVLILSPACVHAFSCHPLISSHLSLSLSPSLCLSENEEWWNLSVPVATGGTWIEASASRCLIYDNVYR